VKQKELTMNLQQLEIFVKDLDSRIQDMETIKNPIGMQGKIDHIYGEIEHLTNTLSEIIHKLNAFAKDEKYIELFSDSEIKEMYLSSDLTSTEIKKYIEKNILNDEKISMSTVSRYTNGHIEDLKIRSQIGKYLRHENIKKNRENKT
jgi:hypothetical protein